MAPPNPFWVQRYLRDHNLDALLGEAVNQVGVSAPAARPPRVGFSFCVPYSALITHFLQAVEQRSADPAASLAQYFSLLSKRNGELTKISARRVLNRCALPLTLPRTRTRQSSRTGCGV